MVANSVRTAKLSHQDSSFVVQHHESDSPLLPVAQMERLASIYPAAIPFILEQTAKEGEFRRQEPRRINRRVFATRTIGQLCALMVALAAIAGGCYIAIKNPAHVYAGAAIAIAAISGLAIAFISERRRSA